MAPTPPPRKPTFLAPGALNKSKSNAKLSKGNNLLPGFFSRGGIGEVSSRKASNLPEMFPGGGHGGNFTKNIGRAPSNESAPFAPKSVSGREFGGAPSKHMGSLITPLSDASVKNKKNHEAGSGSKQSEKEMGQNVSTPHVSTNKTVVAEDVISPIREEEATNNHDNDDTPTGFAMNFFFSSLQHQFVAHNSSLILLTLVAYYFI